MERYKLIYKIENNLIKCNIDLGKNRDSHVFNTRNKCNYKAEQKICQME